MSNPASQGSRALTEAADWLARQCSSSVTVDELYAFREWRRDPENAAAFASVEATWKLSGSLSDRPALRAAADAALRKYPARRQAKAAAVGRRALYGLAAASLVAVVGAGLTLQQPPTFKTRVGEQRVITLDDGSRVHLNTDSKLVVRYSPDERGVELAHGEAFFEAAHDASRPFIVAADGARVRALGTKFDVRRDADVVRVTLLEGRVQVASAAQATRATLTPNQQLTVSRAGLSAVRATDAAETSIWTSGRLVFHDTPLEDAISEVNRYSHRKVILDGPSALARQPVSGAFNTGDTKAFVSAVEGAFDLQSATRPNGEIHLGATAAKPAA